ncbi:adenylyl-sulfate kinase [Paenarthrobacter sp. TAF1]|jgi:adenylylsulfate kinase-like enzyme|uniref:AAA family ATPase n=1 Tax=Paenarthrobacter sp. TAF1 TaxID=3233067 RepID=UPI00037B3699
MRSLERGIFLNGTVGVGKTTVAHCIGDALEEIGIAHAVIDLDAIRCAWPAPVGDKFNHEIELINLASLVKNYANAGIETFVLAGVIEDAKEIRRYRHALGGKPLDICRITASEAILRERLTGRHKNDPHGLRWHLDRAGELDDILTERSLDDFVVSSSGRSAESVAQDILKSVFEHAAEERRATGA